MKLLLKQFIRGSFAILLTFSAPAANAVTELTIIGSGACLPMPNRRHPGNLIQVNDKRFLVDSGPGTLHSLTLLGIKADQLSGVFYTHFHHDHIGELANIIGWFQVVSWTAEKVGLVYPAPAFTIYGPVGIHQQVQNALPQTPEKALPSNIFVVEVKPDDRLNLTTFTVQVGKVPHTPESVGYRFTFNNGKVLAITGDTAFSVQVTNLIKNADVAVLECSYDDTVYETTKPFVNHLGPTTAGQLATAGKIKTLVLTHLYPSADAADTTGIASKVFAGNVITAQDGMIISLD